ncbi:hypothetical protein A2714_04940 [Candidatus Woesebacteria bacterium RIFCSPHIGHO2_01_FULL_38_9]|uniref:Capsule synthesis protein CapA domain-containing protein n=1 Tax=Candidatus Woesebacteria bacterium RIFCSPHIGHO2_01_FULL_38_9 TaxID=1802492 RepID=A0A1F7XY38_9BACT|nr:MAG: hypothetical protein A2714_04940 [Candidatus Woesebacteria bacterium RIFCSPHIGHO2_01_FULL_38_9]
MHSLQKFTLFGIGFLLLILLYSSSKSPIENNSGRKSGNSLSPKSDTIPNSDVSILLTGDVMLGRTVMIKSLESGDPNYPFLKVAGTLRSADITFVNLENPIIANCPKYESGFIFCALPAMVKGLTFAGIDVVNLANNHSRNFGEKGLEETVKILKDNGILATGLGRLVTIERDGQVFGFLGFDFTVKNLTEADLKLIKESDTKVDILIVAVHWGVEYTSTPTKQQREWARQMADAGADVISGHHPHWVQGIECFEKPKGVDTIPPLGWNRFTPQDNTCPSNSTLVYYSLGNFVFDQMWSEETKKGMVVELNFLDSELQSINQQKTYMFKSGQPQFVKD